MTATHKGRAGHKDRVAELERAPPADPEFWQRPKDRASVQEAILWFLSSERFGFHVEPDRQS